MDSWVVFYLIPPRKYSRRVESTLSVVSQYQTNNTKISKIFDTTKLIRNYFFIKINLDLWI